MTKKCIGCGVILQSENSCKKGYIRKDKYEDALYCESCFKFMHYGTHSNYENKINIDEIMKSIDKKENSIINIIDVLTINEESVRWLKELKCSKKYVLLTKYDLLPKSVKEKKIIEYFKTDFNNKCEVMCVSSKKKYNIDTLLEKIKNDKINKIYLIGQTNAGKSTFLNSLLSSKNQKPFISVSAIPNTTSECIRVRIDGIEFIDTPGFNDDNSIYSFLNEPTLKKITPKKTLKVKTFQIKKGYSIIVEDILRIDYLEGGINSFNFYMNDTINYRKVKTIKNNELFTLPNKIFKIDDPKDIVINGLGFIKINRKGLVKVSSLEEKVISVRNKMI